MVVKRERRAMAEGRCVCVCEHNVFRSRPFGKMRRFGRQMAVLTAQPRDCASCCGTEEQLWSRCWGCSYLNCVRRQTTMPFQSA